MRYHLAGLMALLLIACRKDVSSATRDEATPPPSIQAMIESMAIDSAIAGTTPIKVTLKGNPGEHDRPGVLWKAGALVKLSVGEMDSAGYPAGENLWYLRNDTVVAARGPKATYAFKDGHLVEWTDQAGELINADKGQLVARDHELRQAASRWLAQFQGP